LNAGVDAESTDNANGDFGIVDADRVGAEPGLRQGVEPEMALQVKQSLVEDITEFGRLDAAKAGAARDEIFDAVELRREVQRRPGVPDVPVRGQLLAFEGGKAHARMAAGDRFLTRTS
jgi:hypothetical protein